MIVNFGLKINDSCKNTYHTRTGMGGGAFAFVRADGQGTPPSNAIEEAGFDSFGFYNTWKPRLWEFVKYPSDAAGVKHWKSAEDADERGVFFYTCGRDRVETNGEVLERGMYGTAAAVVHLRCEELREDELERGLQLQREPRTYTSSTELDESSGYNERRNSPGMVYATLDVSQKEIDSGMKQTRRQDCRASRFPIDLPGHRVAHPSSCHTPRAIRSLPSSLVLTLCIALGSLSGNSAITHMTRGRTPRRCRRKERKLEGQWEVGGEGMEEETKKGKRRTVNFLCLIHIRLPVPSALKWGSWSTPRVWGGTACRQTTGVRVDPAQEEDADDPPSTIPPHMPCVPSVKSRLRIHGGYLGQAARQGRCMRRPVRIDGEIVGGRGDGACNRYLYTSNAENDEALGSIQPPPQVRASATLAYISGGSAYRSERKEEDVCSGAGQGRREIEGDVGRGRRPLRALGPVSASRERGGARRTGGAVPQAKGGGRTQRQMTWRAVRRSEVRTGAAGRAVIGRFHPPGSSRVQMEREVIVVADKKEGGGARQMPPSMLLANNTHHHFSEESLLRFLYATAHIFVGGMPQHMSLLLVTDVSNAHPEMLNPTGSLAAWILDFRRKWAPHDVIHLCASGSRSLVTSFLSQDYNGACALLWDWTYGQTEYSMHVSAQPCAKSLTRTTLALPLTRTFAGSTSKFTKCRGNKYVAPCLLCLHSYSCTPPRDRYFLRALLYHKFVTRREEIASHHPLFTVMYPGATSRILFDLSKGACGKIIFARLGDETLKSRCGFYMERAARSDGKLQKHFVKVLEDG
ncbi:hypothetical protein C8R45DRAFT_928723 [Mycena sanguinolenta]|nr:hypothetical protein C8R45DRAFT_928723 [Mycena sanguinolenta]